MATVQLNAAPVGGLLQTGFSGNIVVPANGLITVDVRDVVALLSLGCSYVNARVESAAFGACRLGTAGRIVASTALANGTLTIANQPDVPRQCSIRIDPGAGTITAGSAVMTYTANDGTTTADTVALAASAVFTSTSTKGVLVMSSVVVSALAGGSSPKVEVTDTNSLSMTVDVGYQNFAVVKAITNTANDVIGTVATAAASVIPNTAPNGTNTYSFQYSYIMPNT